MADGWVFLSLADDPGEPGLDGRGGNVDVGAVEAEPGFQPERIARPQSGRLDLGLFCKQPDQAFGVGGGDGYLIAVLAGVTGPGDEARGTADLERVRGHERHGRRARLETGQHRRGRRSLKGDHGAVPEDFQFRPAADVVLDVGEVVLLAGRVDHQEKAGTAIRHHQVVDDAAPFVGQDRVTGLAFGQAPEVARHQGFQRLGGAVAQKVGLTHVGNVEQRSLPAGVQVFGDDAAGVLERHPIAGERHHLGALLPVKGIERGFLDGFGFLVCHEALR